MPTTGSRTQYQSVEELPADNWYASKHVIIVHHAPESWPEFVRVQLFVHDWDRQKRSWQTEPIAFTQGTMTPKRKVAGSLFLLRPPGSEGKEEWNSENATLAPGKYLIKAFVDEKRGLTDDPTVLLGEDDFYGEAEIGAHWRRGFREAEKLAGDLFLNERK